MIDKMDSFTARVRFIDSWQKRIENQVVDHLSKLKNETSSVDLTTIKETFSNEQLLQIGKKIIFLVCWFSELLDK